VYDLTEIGKVLAKVLLADFVTRHIDRVARAFVGPRRRVACWAGRGGRWFLFAQAALFAVAFNGDLLVEVVEASEKLVENQ
jgi:hypothetical protein